jgi:hypothetical protein
MTDSLLEDRRKALEEQFFKKQDAELLQRMREQRAEQERRQALATASGVRDEAALEAMVQADIGPETLAALGLVPLVAVAWADGKLDDDEREAVLSAARGLGLEEGGPADRLLVGWLESRPPHALLETWEAYVKALPAQVREALRPDVLGRAREVAEAAGGFLGLGSKVSDDERRVLGELERALE